MPSPYQPEPLLVQSGRRLFRFFTCCAGFLFGRCVFPSLPPVSSFKQWSLLTVSSFQTSSWLWIGNMQGVFGLLLWLARVQPRNSHVQINKMIAT